MTKGDDIEERLLEFAVQTIRVCGKLPKTDAGRHLGVQLLRSGTSTAPNYGEARGAESRNDFIHKLRIVLKELKESAVWLEIAKRSGLADASTADSLRDECSQLARIISTSIKTARANR